MNRTTMMAVFGGIATLFGGYQLMKYSDRIVNWIPKGSDDVDKGEVKIDHDNYSSSEDEFVPYSEPSLR